MNKKWLLGIILVLTTTAIVIIGTLSIDKRYNKIVLEESEWINIEKTHSKSTSLKIDNIKFDDYSLIVDDKNSTIYYSVVNTSNKWNPRIRVISNNKKISIGALENLTEKQVAENHKYKIMVYNKEQYRVYDLVVTLLPIMNIRYNIDNQTKFQMELSLFDNSVNSVRRSITSMGTLNIKENNSPKEDYTFSLKSESLGRNRRENNISLFGMQKHSEYVLKSMWEDEEKVRNVFTTNLWIDLENEKMDRFRYVELFINDEYKGLYSLGYDIEGESLLLDEDEFMFYKKTFAPSETNVTASTRLEGYTLYDSQVNKVRNKEELSPACPPGKENCNNIDAWEELVNYYQILEEKDANKIKSHINEKNAIDLYLYYIFVQASNNVNEESFRNTYMLFRNTKTGYQVNYKPWNMTFTFGNYQKDEDAINYGLEATDNSYIMPKNPITVLIDMKDEETIKKVKEEYQNLRQNSWKEENIDKIIIKQEEELMNSGAYLREIEKYPIDKKIYNLNQLREYVKNRLKAMDEYVQSL